MGQISEVEEIPGGIDVGSQDGERGSNSGQKKPIDTLQYVWFAGHIFTSIASILLIVAYALLQGHELWAVVLYRITFATIVMTYGISLRKKLLGQIPSFYALLPIETFQYWLLAIAWLVTSDYLLKLISYSVYSILQSANFVSTKLIPGTPNAEKIDRFISQHSHRMELAVSRVSLLLLLRLILDVLMVRMGSGLSLVAYGVFYRIRFEYAPLTRETLKEAEAILDRVFSYEKMPPKVTTIWKRVKYTVDNYQMYQLTPKKKEQPPAATTTGTAPRDAHKRTGSDSDLFLNGK
jgi:hypothetical protein